MLPKGSYKLGAPVSFTDGRPTSKHKPGPLVRIRCVTYHLENLAAILQAAGSGLNQVVKTTVYLVDMKDFPAMNEVYARAFGEHRPARATVAVAALPKGARVEIDAIAYRD